MLKEYNIEGIDPFADLQKKVWQILDTFKHESIDVSNYYLILFFLSLQKDGLLENLNHSNSKELNDKIRDNIERSNNNSRELYIKLLDLYNPSISSISNLGISDILLELRGLNQIILKSNFSKLFDYILYRLSKSQGKSAGEYSLPFELSSFICSLIELPKNGTVYNPFAGFASFDVFLNQFGNYLGQEMNPTTWAIGSLRIMAYERTLNSSFILGNSIENWNPSNNKYDLIISNPPFGVRMGYEWNTSIGKVRSYEAFFIQNGVDDLKENGKLIAIVPQSFLNDSSSISLITTSDSIVRRNMVENDLLEMVISFPGGLLLNTIIPIVVLVINKAKKEKGKVKFIDAKEFINTSPNKEINLNFSLLKSLISSKTETESLKIVANDTIKKFEYNLRIQRYLHAEYDGVALGKIGYLISGQRVSDELAGKFIRIRDLKDDKLHFNLDVDAVESVEIPRHAKKIEETCVLLACRWKTLKPTFFKYTGIPIYIDLDIIAFKTDEAKLDLGYFIGELNSGYIFDQIESYRSGDGVPRIKKEDILNIKIKLPIHSEQVEKRLQAQKEFLSIEEQKLSQLRKDIGLDVADQNSFLRHQIAGPLRQIRSSVKNIRGILDKYIPDMIPDFYNLKLSNSTSLTLGNYFEILERDLKSVNKSTQKSGLDIELKELNTSRIEITQFVRDYYSELKERKNKIYELELIIVEEYLYDVDGIAFIIGDQELIRKMFNNLIENAESHAFQNRYSIKNRIDIGLTFDFKENEVQIYFCNSGLPVELGFSLEKFTAKGIKTGANGGDGIGLWYINEIVKIHGGKLGFINDAQQEGYVGNIASTFEIKFPIQIEYNNNDEI